MERGAESALLRFEELWQQGQRPDLAAHLPPEPAAQGTVLLGLAHIDLEYRVRAGQAARVEDYLARYPELAADPGAVLSLLSAEYRLRRRSEPGLTAQEYATRFPQVADRLAECLRAGADGGRAQRLRVLARRADEKLVRWFRLPVGGVETGAAALLAAGTDESLGRLRSLIRSELLALTEAPAAADSAPLFGTRGLVDAVFRRLCGAEALPREQELRFFEAAAAELRQLGVERAARNAFSPSMPPPADAPTAPATVTDAASATVLDLAQRDPAGVLKRDRLLTELAPEGEAAHRILMLFDFAGRPPGEIARLLGLAGGEDEATALVVDAHRLLEEAERAG
jgi:hypothetical protein